MAAAKPSASVPPWLLMTMPLRPRNTPPLARPGSSCLAQLVEGGAREQIADAAAERASHRVAQIAADLASGTLGGLERDVAGKAFGDHDIDLAGADVVTFDKADIIEIGQLPLAQHPTGFAHFFQSLHFFHTDIEKSHRSGA